MDHFLSRAFRSDIRSPDNAFVINIQKSSVHLYQKDNIISMSENLLTFSGLELFLAGITSVLFIIQILYYLVTYARPLRAAKTAKNTEQIMTDKKAKPVSVIVYAHGEPDDLRSNLPVLLNQDYPDYEIIVVNDGSDADCEDVLKLFSNEYKNLYYTYVPVDTGTYV